MKRILPILIVFILVLSGLGAGASTGANIKKEKQQTFEKNNKINNDFYEIEAKYSYIRSYPEGGGIFLIKMTPKTGFSGYVSLEIDSDSKLNAKLDKKILNKQNKVSELTIEPDEKTEMKTYEIVLTSKYHKKTKTADFFDWINKIKFPILTYIINRLFKFINYKSSPDNYYQNEEIILEVEIFNWTSENLPDAIIKRDQLVNWLELDHPEFGTFSNQNNYAYLTYPAHYVVEHWTFLYEKWEMRICYHVMIPPHDWSMVWLRPRGEFDAIFSAKRESDGTIYEIPITEYPIMYGY